MQAFERIQNERFVKAGNVDYSTYHDAYHAVTHVLQRVSADRSWHNRSYGRSQLWLSQAAGVENAAIPIGGMRREVSSRKALADAQEQGSARDGRSAYANSTGGGTIDLTEDGLEEDRGSNLGLQEGYTDEDRFISDLRSRISALLKIEEPDMHLTGWRRVRFEIWRTMDDPSYSIYAAILAMVILVFIFLSVSFFLADSVPSVSIDYSTGDAQQSWAVHQQNVEYVCVAVFTLEYLVRILSCPRPWSFLFSLPSLIGKKPGGGGIPFMACPPLTTFLRCQICWPSPLPTSAWASGTAATSRPCRSFGSSVWPGYSVSSSSSGTSPLCKC